MLLIITFLYIVSLSFLSIQAESVLDNSNIFTSTGNNSSRSFSNIVTTPSSSPSTLVLSSSLCHVIGYKLVYQSGYDNDDMYYIGGREDIEVLDDKYFMCYENIGDNIEAIMNPECNTTALKEQGGVQMLLRNRAARRNASDINSLMFIRNQTEYSSPYYLYGNIGSQIYGKVIPVGSYQLTSIPMNNRVGRKRINFNMVYCQYYAPLNECNSCTPGSQTCEGSQCVTTSPEGIRIVLLTYGQNVYDFGMNITSPFNTTINAYHETHSRYLYKTDQVTGGYVDKDYMADQCRSTGVWIKNIIYPVYIPGIYSITLENILKCNIFGPPSIGNAPNTPPPPNQNRYSISIYRNETLIKFIAPLTNPAGKVFKFTL